MTDNLAGQIRRDLWAIKDTFDEALQPARRATSSHVTTTKEPPLPIAAHVLDVRADTRRDLIYWTGFIIDNVRDINGDTLQHTPRSLDVDVLVPFIATWVDWLITNTPDDADNLAGEMGKHAKALLDIVFLPPLREWVEIGSCPRTVAVDGERVTCATKLRAYPGRETITCDGCQHDDTVDWWREQVVGHRPEYVTPAELANVLLVDLQVSVDPSTIRQWFQRGRIERHGRDDKGRWLYDWKHVVGVLLGRHAA